MKYKKILFLLPILLFFAACEIDNYDEPDGGIYGTLTDNITNEPLQSEQPNGFNIKLFERDGQMNSPIIFSGKPDGTYENAWIFQNEYKVLPTEGAFFPVDTITVNVGARTELNFTVTPFLAVVDASVQPSAGKVTASYGIARSRVGDKIIERKTLVSKIPTVNNAIYNWKQDTNVSGIADEALLEASFTDEVTGLPSGNYYVRIAVTTNNALKRYNYSKVFEVTIP
ncbi:DUF3823 domain-containing protein [Proteiniphilum acetatigenes]|uniref:DUF3823 domain-containing protein n=1 Tax=Proteiniphilum acetatigenes TaxID=294710 RepID=UPI00037E8D2B|nr:DUF3823 domain-containing protein [Proteiniphilum acetatigenes]